MQTTNLAENWTLRDKLMGYSFLDVLSERCGYISQEEQSELCCFADEIPTCRLRLSQKPPGKL